MLVNVASSEKRILYKNDSFIMASTRKILHDTHNQLLKVLELKSNNTGENFVLLESVVLKTVQLQMRLLIRVDMWIYFNCRKY